MSYIFYNFQSKCPSFKDNSYKTIYSCDMGKEAAILAVFSLVLTIVNTMCILITATVVLKVNEKFSFLSFFCIFQK